jgi:hypothetical protein
MEYREKQYRVVLGIDSLWKWSVDGIEGYTKSGKAPSHAAGSKAAERAIDKALAQKRNACAVRNEEAASVRVGNLSLAVAGFASERIDFAARLCRLHHHREARAIARDARMLFDFLHHVEPFRPATEAASFSVRSLPTSSSINSVSLSIVARSPIAAAIRRAWSSRRSVSLRA